MAAMSARSASCPTTYFAVPLTDQFFVGLSVNAPYGFSTTSDTPWVGMTSHLNAQATAINVTPMMGIKFNDMVSVAFGVQVQYFDVEIETALLPAAGRPKQTIKGDSTDVGIVAGITLTPFDGTTIGIGYRSQIDTSLDGTQSFEVPIGARPDSGRQLRNHRRCGTASDDLGRPASAGQRRVHVHGGHGMDQLEQHPDGAVRRFAGGFGSWPSISRMDGSFPPAASINSIPI